MYYYHAWPHAWNNHNTHLMHVILVTQFGYVSFPIVRNVCHLQSVAYLHFCSMYSNKMRHWNKWEEKGQKQWSDYMQTMFLFYFNLVLLICEIYSYKVMYSPAGLGDMRIRGTSTVTSLKIKNMNCSAKYHIYYIWIKHWKITMHAINASLLPWC